MGIPRPLFQPLRVIIEAHAEAGAGISPFPLPSDAVMTENDCRRFGVSGPGLQKVESVFQ